MTNTFGKYSKNIPEFFKQILSTNPDYIVPVERKGCKLLRFLNISQDSFIPQIRYKQFFDNTKPNIKGKKIAIIDDASKYTSTLLLYRNHFEKMGAEVNTFSFVGQIKLETAEREKYDSKAKIFQFLDESTYQEYIIQQSQKLSMEDTSFDIDHLVITLSVEEDVYIKFKKSLCNLGAIVYSNDVYTPDHIEKFCLYDFLFPVKYPFDLSNGVYKSPIEKIRFAYNKSNQKLSIVPITFPTWDTNQSYDVNTIPFELLYQPNRNIELEGKYMNLVYIFNLYLLKCFIMHVGNCIDFSNMQIHEYDLNAYIGEKRLKTICDTAKKFLINNSYSLDDLRCNCLPKQDQSKNKNAPLHSMLNIMNELRGEYEKLLSKSRLTDTKYFLSYDEILSRYQGTANVMKWIDILSDRGVLVARNVLENGFFYRACRSGEGDYDHAEKKTSLLIPIVINLCGKKEIVKFDNKERIIYKINSTLLNKILANFSYDYPKDKYDFHTMFYKPYFYGPLTYTENPLTNEMATPIYKIQNISKYCSYNAENDEFISVDILDTSISANIDSFFSQTDSVPFTEITNYIQLLKHTAEVFKKASSLNELMICRDQDIFYRHIHFDVVTAFQRINVANTSLLPYKTEQNLREASKITNAAISKLKYNQKEFYETFEKEFGSNIEYRKSYKKIMDSVVEFDNDFTKILSKIKNITTLESALINLLLYKHLYNKRYLSIFCKKVSLLNGEIYNDAFEHINNLSALAQASDEEYSKDYNKYEKSIDYLVDYLYHELSKWIYDVPKPQESDYVRSNKKRNIEAAMNNAIHYIKKHDLSQYTVLYFDFSGFRNTDCKQAVNVVHKVREATKCLLDGMESSAGSNNGGIHLYGLEGAEPFAFLLFKDINCSVSFSKKLIDVLETYHLEQLNFKFGCSHQKVCYDLNSKNIEEICKDSYTCVKQSTPNDIFVISNKTYEILDNTIRKDFGNMHGEDFKYYTHDTFKSNEKIIKYDEETDTTITIGIITALTEEFVAMRCMMSNPRTAIFPSKVHTDSIDREFCIGQIRSLDNHYHNVALIQTIGPGNISAYERAKALLSRFPNINTIFMTGIAGGIPDIEDIQKHVRLGDVVVASGIESYDFVSDKENRIEPRDKIVPPSARITEAQNRLNAMEMMNDKPWNKYILEASEILNHIFKKPDINTDKLHDSDGNEISHPHDEYRDEYPKIFKGKIATANRVLKNPKKRDELKAQYDVRAVEMESSGISNAAWSYNVGYYVVRGISDYCDGKKNDIWHNYASLVAAAYTRSLIENLSN